MVHSTCMRNCFLLASTDGTADVAYALASHYENLTFNPEVQDAERTLMADINFRRRRLGVPEAASATAGVPLRLGGRSLFPSLAAAQAAAAAAQAELSPERMAARREAAQERAARWLRILRADAAADGAAELAGAGAPGAGAAGVGAAKDARRRRGEEEEEPGVPAAQTDEAYLAVAVATSISLVGAGALHVLYGTLIMWSLLNIFPAAATLHALGGGCCSNPNPNPNPTPSPSPSPSPSPNPNRNPNPNQAAAAAACPTSRLSCTSGRCAARATLGGSWVPGCC